MCVLAHGIGRLGRERVVVLDQRHEPRARYRDELDAGVERAHELRVTPGLDGRLGGEEPDPPVSRRLHGGVRLGRDHADDRNGELLLQLRQRGRRGRVARGDDELDALRLQERADLARELSDLVERPRAVRQPCVVTEVEEVLVRQRHEALVEDGQPAHT